MSEKTITVLVARPQGQAEELEMRLRAVGMNALFQPVIEIGEPTDGFMALDTAVAELETFQWVAFSSSNGVEAFLKRLHVANRTFPKTLKIAAIGPGTARTLEKSGFTVNFVPKTYRAENLAEGLKAEAVGGTRFLLIRASRGREILAEILRESGGNVTQAVAYSSTDVTPESTLWNPEIRVALEAGRVDYTTITSSAIATSAVRLFGEALRKTRLVSISSLTSNVLKKLGFPPALEAKNADMSSLVAEICKDWNGEILD